MTGAITFDQFVLDPVSRQLFRRNDDTPLAIPPRIFDTLLYLVAHAGELVSKAELMDAVWPGVVVEENSLSQAISQLRKLLGDGVDGRRLIVTAPGKGFRFVADVGPANAEVSPGAPAPAQQPTSNVRTSLAVLPFTNLTGDPANDYLGDGMADEILGLLSACTGLKLPARASSLAIQRQGLDALAMARTLGVDAILEGSVRRAAERVKISAQLVDGREGYIMWSRTFDRTMSDLLAIQEEVANATVEALLENLNGSLRPLVPMPTGLRGNAAAYQIALKSYWLAGQGTERAAIAAERLSTEAVALDENSAMAHAVLALLSSMRGVQSRVPNGAGFADGLRSAERALQIDPNCIEALLSKATILALQGRFIDAEAVYSNVIEGRPSLAMAYMSRATLVTQSAGHLERSMPDLFSLEVFTPFHPQFATLLALGNVMLRQNDEAERLLDLAVSCGVPADSLPYADVRAMLHSRKGNYELAAQAVLAAGGGSPDELWSADRLRLIYRAINDAAFRGSAMEAMEDLASSTLAKGEFMRNKRIILWYAQLGRADLSAAHLLETVRRLKQAGTVGAGWSFIWLPEAAQLVREPLFVEAAREIGLVDYWQLRGPPDGYHFTGDLLIPAN